MKKDKKLMDSELHKLVYGYNPEGGKERPIPGLIAKGMSEEKAVELAEIIRKFAAYAFNKSHSAGYAILCYQTAWLKAHYPYEFMSALLTSVCGNKEKVIKYIEDAKKMGIPILPPDINASSYGFTIEGNALRYGLGSISGLGLTNVDNIIRCRPFTSVEDLINRTEKKAVNKKVLTALALSGSLDSISSANSTLRHRLDILQLIYQLRNDKDELDVDNFAEGNELQHEVEYLGMYLSRHPLDNIAEPIDWEKKWHNDIFDCTAIILDYRKIQTKKGDDMAFVDIETLEGRKNLVLFPSVYNKVKGRLRKDEVVTFTIRKQYKGKEDSYIIENIKAVEQKENVS